MPNVKILIEGKWSTYVNGRDGVKNIFVDNENAGVVILGEEITTFVGFPFVLERDYKKED